MDITWLNSLTETSSAGGQQRRRAHAVMLIGAPGSGKRAAAVWLARQHLNLQKEGVVPQYPVEIPEHADLRWVSTLEDKHQIGIDQIRALVANLALTSYTGDGKVAVIEPADAMTHSAANSLLKTLEEPSGNALIILVVDRMGRLPATIYSRCQQIKVATPSEEEGLRWLQQLKPGVQWARPLQSAGYAPLAAIGAAEQSEVSGAMETEFASLLHGQAAPLEVAAKWSKADPEFVLAWIGRQVEDAIKRLAGCPLRREMAPIRESVLTRIDRRNLFCYLDIINRLRGQPTGSYNVQLTLESLLIDWASGLKSVMDNE